jgi:hypothetical protein
MTAGLQVYVLHITSDQMPQLLVFQCWLSGFLQYGIKNVKDAEGMLAKNTNKQTHFSTGNTKITVSF